MDAVCAGCVPCVNNCVKTLSVSTVCLLRETSAQNARKRKLSEERRCCTGIKILSCNVMFSQEVHLLFDQPSALSRVIAWIYTLKRTATGVGSRSYRQGSLAFSLALSCHEYEVKIRYPRRE